MQGADSTFFFKKCRQGNESSNSLKKILACEEKATTITYNLVSSSTIADKLIFLFPTVALTQALDFFCFFGIDHALSFKTV